MMVAAPPLVSVSISQQTNKTNNNSHLTATEISRLVYLLCIFIINDNVFKVGFISGGNGLYFIESTLQYLNIVNAQ